MLHPGDGTDLARPREDGVGAEGDDVLDCGVQGGGSGGLAVAGEGVNPTRTNWGLAALVRGVGLEVAVLGQTGVRPAPGWGRGVRAKRYV